MQSSIVARCLFFVLVAVGPGFAAPPLGTATGPLLWRDPGPLGAKDLYSGAARADTAPRPPFMFVKEDTSGTKPKVQVTDHNGALWTAKFASKSRTGTEVHAEIAASRLLWAFGYFVEEHYFVAEGRITGAQLGRRASRAIDQDGRFKVARFERRPPEVVRADHWDLESNPFAASRELSGLKMLVLLLNNWDARPGNTRILRVSTEAGAIEERYLLSDVGTAFGRMGGARKGTRWNLAHYASGDFIHGRIGDALEFCHGLDQSPPLRVPVEHAQWLAQMASQLDRAQVRRAFEASGANSNEVEGFTTVVMNRFDQLAAAVTGTQGEGCH
jgi:hypothetical protein